jgi:mannose/cellobiose epimerase-like protein (N-acyl-D-glucosamine 2-epimerase family)
MYKVTGDSEVLKHVERTIAFIDENLDGRSFDGIHSELLATTVLETKKHAIGGNAGGFRDQMSVGMFELSLSRKHANPHMYMLEAFMALYSATGLEHYLQRAASIVDLFTSRIFDHEHSVVLELFDHEMKPFSSIDGQWIEPGHMYEWAHLLITYGELTGENLVDYSRRLFAMAEAFGRSAQTGLVMDRFDMDWQPLENTSRLWPQLERLRAMISLKKSGHNTHDRNIEKSINTIFQSYLAETTLGLWDDCVDEAGALVSETVPQSTFYHLVAAFADYLSLTRDKSRLLD